MLLGETGRFNHVDIASDVTIRINQITAAAVMIYYIYIYVNDTIKTHTLIFHTVADRIIEKKKDRKIPELTEKKKETFFALTFFL